MDREITLANREDIRKLIEDEEFDKLLDQMNGGTINVVLDLENDSTSITIDARDKDGLETDATRGVEKKIGGLASRCFGRMGLVNQEEAPAEMPKKEPAANESAAEAFRREMAVERPKKPSEAGMKELLKAVTGIDIQEMPEKIRTAAKSIGEKAACDKTPWEYVKLFAGMSDEEKKAIFGGDPFAMNSLTEAVQKYKESPLSKPIQVRDIVLLPDGASEAVVLYLYKEPNTPDGTQTAMLFTPERNIVCLSVDILKRTGKRLLDGVSPDMAFAD